VNTAQYITGAKHPAIQDLYTRRYQNKAPKIVKDYRHTSHRLFTLPSNGNRYQPGTNRILDSFYTEAIRLLNIISKGYFDYLR
jgi:hypothetical protein